MVQQCVSIVSRSIILPDLMMMVSEDAAFKAIITRYRDVSIISETFLVTPEALVKKICLL